MKIFSPLFCIILFASSLQSCSSGQLQESLDLSVLIGLIKNECPAEIQEKIILSADDFKTVLRNNQISWYYHERTNCLKNQLYVESRLFKGPIYLSRNLKKIAIHSKSNVYPYYAEFKYHLDFYLYYLDKSVDSLKEVIYYWGDYYQKFCLQRHYKNFSNRYKYLKNFLKEHSQKDYTCVTPLFNVLKMECGQSVLQKTISVEKISQIIDNIPIVFVWKSTVDEFYNYIANNSLHSDRNYIIFFENLEINECSKKPYSKEINSDIDILYPNCEGSYFIDTEKFGVPVLYIYHENHSKFYYEHEIERVYKSSNYEDFLFKWALKKGQTDIYLKILNQSRHPHYIRKVVHWVLDNNRIDIDEKIMNHIDIDSLNGDRDTYLINACKKGNVDRVSKLIELGADVNLYSYKISDNITPLMHALRRGHTDIAKLLIGAGANVDPEPKHLKNGYCSNWECFSLLFALKKGYFDIFDQLITSGANLDLQDRLGYTVLATAVQKGYVEIVDQLIKSGANLDLPECHCWTPLMLAIDHVPFSKNHEEIALKLIASGVNLYCKNEYGESALDRAVERKRTNIESAIRLKNLSNLVEKLFGTVLATVAFLLLKKYFSKNRVADEEKSLLIE